MANPSAADRQREVVVGAPKVARVSITTLEALRDALDGEASAAEIDELRADLTYLIDAARWTGEAL